MAAHWIRSRSVHTTKNSTTKKGSNDEKGWLPMGGLDYRTIRMPAPRAQKVWGDVHLQNRVGTCSFEKGRTPTFPKSTSGPRGWLHSSPLLIAGVCKKNC
eukprot:7915623-Pyramimonas_sp.AAC.1